MINICCNSHCVKTLCFVWYHHHPSSQAKGTISSSTCSSTLGWRRCINTGLLVNTLSGNPPPPPKKTITKKQQTTTTKQRNTTTTNKQAKTWRTAHVDFMAAFKLTRTSGNCYL